ncbi:uroporphyrinogen-III C-methyltransferase [Oceanospirillum maris]|uniref:uroporphyrinogen-III C-methyltransferase n=1 Tax=Oceanospirillum maris TaxID=64977 RepID=UPI00042736E5|nr:uroporphyrinogen-III C-methyltransferase [Oceanospirillum maris]
MSDNEKKTPNNTPNDQAGQAPSAELNKPTDKNTLSSSETSEQKDSTDTNFVLVKPEPDQKESVDQQSPVDKTSSSTEAPQQSTEAPKKAQKPQPPQKKSSPILALSALVIALGAAAISGYTFWQQQEQTTQTLQQLGERNNQLATQLQQQKQALDLLQNLPNTANILNQQTQVLQKKQGEQRLQLLDLAAAFAKTQGPKPSDWLQAEAEYLLRIANHRVQLEGDITGAKTLLASADDRLQKADNPALFAVREAIANELAALNSVNVLDQSGLYFKLSALEGQINQLPLPLEPENRSAFQQKATEKETQQSVWQTLWNEAKTLVVVRYQDEKITPLLPPQESLYLRHNLRLTLQQAQIALLKEEQQLFLTLINQASSWVKTHFDQTHARTQSMLATLDLLAQQNIHQQRPNISGSLTLLRDLQKQRFSSSAPVNTSAKPETTSTPKNATTQNEEAPAS